MLVKVPGVNGLGKTKGTRDAGNKVLEKLQGDYDIEEIHVNNDLLGEQEDLIYKNSLKMFEGQDKTIFLGGDHSISYGIGKAFLEWCKSEKKEPGLIVFDAHADLMPAMKEPTHEEWLRALIDNCNLEAKNILLIGARKIEPEEQEFINSHGIEVVDVSDLEGIKEFCSGKEVYVSFDIDVFNSNIVKATGYLEEGGLGKEEVFGALDVISGLNWKGMDLVEIDLDKPGISETLEIGAEVVRKFMGQSQ
tara:strand:- start:1191 stop:1937 length:747 start_codon:yes stop_codon:yes gene_type:complete